MCANWPHSWAAWESWAEREAGPVCQCFSVGLRPMLTGKTEIRKEESTQTPRIQGPGSACRELWSVFPLQVPPEREAGTTCPEGTEERWGRCPLRLRRSELLQEPKWESKVVPVGLRGQLSARLRDNCSAVCLCRSAYSRFFNGINMWSSWLASFT